MRALSNMIGQDLRSGLWLKDEGSFINAREARQANVLEDVLIYDFDAESRLRQLTSAKRAEYAGKGGWRLSGVKEVHYAPQGPRTVEHAELVRQTGITPDLLDALIVKPERMSAFALHRYTEHLAGNRQATERYEIALWKKLLYPFATLVMMALALPFAYMHARAGMVGLKVFSGIMIGIFFHMLNSLFSHIGLLQNWPPFAAAAVPSTAFFIAAVGMMWWVERR
jgi:lipopolysaccharide export system permease protein